MNNSLHKTPMRVRPPEERIADFEEVALGYTEEEAMAEAQRCLHCKNAPCMSGCPVVVNIPDFIAHLREGRPEEAYQTIKRTSALPAVCGRVCPQENQCEKMCVRGKRGEPVAIGRLERFAADCHAALCSEEGASPGQKGAEGTEGAQSENTKVTENDNKIKVAVVGSGPAGLACAGELASRGFAVTVFEALHRAGGVLVYGIPEFRLPKRIVLRELKELERQGVKIMTNTVVGKTVTLEELKEEGFRAIFLGTGAGLPNFMGIQGENAKGVFSANEYLTRANLMKAYEEDSETPIYRARRVAVVGGGNVAMDAARTARRLGAQVTVVYRRSEAELPARREEVEHAKEEGISFRFLATPKRVLTDEEGNVTGLSCAEMELGAEDASGRRRPVEKFDSAFVLEADAVIMALGTSPNPLLKRTAQGLETGSRGEILADESGRTSLEGVFAGGDAVTGSATVILAMGAGRRAASAIAAYLGSDAGSTVLPSAPRSLLSFRPK